MTDFGGLIRALAAAEVRFVLVGGFAGTVLGSPRVTVDLDVVYARETSNLERLVAARRRACPSRSTCRPSRVD